MSKVRNFSKLIKLAVSTFVYVLAAVLRVIISLVKTLFKGVGKRLRFSITFKTATTYTILFSVIFLILSIVIVSSFGFFLVYEARRSLEKSGRVTVGLLQDSTTLPEAQIQQFAKAEGIDIALLGKQKEVNYNTGEYDSIPSEVISGNQTFYITADNMYVGVWNQSSPNASYIILYKPIVKEKAYLLVLAVVLLVSFLLAVLIMVFMGSRTLRRMLQPIDNMIDTARSVSANRLHTRINVVDSHDELKELAETFNEMLDRIQASYEQQNQFVSDASHELRTPISVIQGYANLLQRWGKEEREVLEESVQAIKNEADNMKELVEQLLFLARADKNTQSVEKECFALNELVEEVVRETRMIDSGHDIISESGRQIDIFADKRLIKQALRIFVDNSIRYTPAGGKIKVTFQEAGNRVRVVVEDNGIGISKEDLPLVFNRFYKSDKSRTRDAGGTGLGLSIAKWIIEKHQGAINIESELNKGTRITVQLPIK